MDSKKLKNSYKLKQKEIKSRLKEFEKLKKRDMQKELMFCILTPQSNAKRCWEAVEQISKLNKLEENKIKEILKTKTRFHNNKTKYILESKEAWNKISPMLTEQNRIELRNKLADNIKGYGLKEASHFLRNIGKSNNQIAILDRHILRNLKAFKVIKEVKIKSRKDYLEKEQKYLNFAKQIGISPDALDLLFWSQENGEIFK
ncbi:MAG TPA: N-glycosylase/DNA lyase [Candidatus Nanoarchaeia archaeon]|nr:N-glycosylase/DNA lyase [Candidatus Nanoarchaeia archaeon]